MFRPFEEHCRKNISKNQLFILCNNVVAYVKAIVAFRVKDILRVSRNHFLL